MPYTKSELRDVDFYNEFVEKLRNNYKDEMKKVVLPPSSGGTNSRKDGVLYSFEHYLTGLGIEEVFVAPNAFHDFLEGEDEEGEFDLYYFHNRSALNSLDVNRKKKMIIEKAYFIWIFPFNI